MWMSYNFVKSIRYKYAWFVVGNRDNQDCSSKEYLWNLEQNLEWVNASEYSCLKQSPAKDDLHQELDVALEETDYTHININKATH